MATTTVDTAQDIIDALAAYGAGDTIYVDDGTYTFTATLEKTGGNIPSIVAVNPGSAIFRFSRTYTWTADGSEYWCDPHRADVENPHTPYEVPYGVWSPDGTPYRQSQSGWFPYDYTSPPQGNQFDVTAAFPTPDNTANFELRCAVQHDILAFRGSVSGSTVTVTNMLDEAAPTAFDWQDEANWQTLARGYMVMGRQADMRPGTWRWDSANDRLYVWPLPGETVNNLRVAQNIRRGLRLEGGSDFCISGIVFEGLNGEPHWGPVGFSDDGAVFLRDCENARVEGVTVRNCASAGIRMKELTSPEGTNACDNAYVSGCTISNVGGQGIVVGGTNSQVVGCSVLKAGVRNLAAPAYVAEYASAVTLRGNTSTNCGGGSLHISANNSGEDDGPRVFDHTSVDDMTNQIGDRGCVYFIGRRAQSGLAAIVTGRNITVTRGTTNGSGDHGVYFDEGSYGTIDNLRIKGFGSRLGWYDPSDLTLVDDEFSGRTIYWNDPDGPTVINGGALVGDIVTLDIRTSSEPVTLNGVRVVTKKGLLTSGTVTRTGTPGVLAS